MNKKDKKEKNAFEKLNINITEGVKKVKDEVKATDSQLETAIKNNPIMTNILIMISLGFLTIINSDFKQLLRFNLKGGMNIFGIISFMLFIIVGLATEHIYKKKYEEEDKEEDKKEKDINTKNQIKIEEQEVEENIKLVPMKVINDSVIFKEVNKIQTWRGRCGNYRPFQIQYNKSIIYFWLGKEGNKKKDGPFESIFNWNKDLEIDETTKEYKTIYNQTIKGELAWILQGGWKKEEDPE